MSFFRDGSTRWVTISLLLFLVSQGELLAQSQRTGLADSTGPMRPSMQAEAWLKRSQFWRRDLPKPILQLGKKGNFDDTHILAPLVHQEDNRYMLWYCGSSNSVAKRVYRLGMATSNDGLHFRRSSSKPVMAFGDGKHSILTPTLLRNPDGTTRREGGKLRMWFSSTHFEKTQLHTLHQSFSTQGNMWSKPSKSQLDHVYAPTVLKDGARYRMWYVDVARSPWVIRTASSSNGEDWKVTPQVCLNVTQKWERDRLFYPTVLKRDGVYFMWYGSYWAARKNTTAIGFAVSDDGLKWYKHPQNPVLRPDPGRFWESHYVTSQTVLPVKGGFRIWYASRKKPPFLNKYFALNTALWTLPER